MQRLRKYAVLFIIACVIPVSIAVNLWVNHWLNQSLTVVEPTTLVIPRGSSVSALANELVRQKLWRGPAWQLTAFDRVTSALPIKAGEYQLVPGITLAEFLKDVRSGKVYLRKVTFPEGWTVRQWLARLEETPGVTRSASTLSQEVLSQQVTGGDRVLEGWLFPDTYVYTFGEADVKILQRAYQAMHQSLARIPRPQSDAALDDQSLLVLASIVEKESGQADDRRKIAQVFLNRLAKGMRLQSDPTVIYGLGKAFDGDLKRHHLRSDGPFNTYTRLGLPPTAIANPGLDAIKAVLYPLPGDWLYFVGRGDGTSEFSLDLKSHRRAVNRYQLGMTP